MKINRQTFIALNNLVKRYPAGNREITVLNKVTLGIQQGEFAAIVGASGNGKSTLLNMITGIDHPTSGEVIVGGKTISSMSEEQLSRWRGKQLGIVFQFFQLLPALNLLQNIILPMDFTKILSKKERRERASYLLDLVGLGGMGKNYPARFPVDSSSALRSHVPWQTIRHCLLRMSRQETWMHAHPLIYSTFSANW